MFDAENFRRRKVEVDNDPSGKLVRRIVRFKERDKALLMFPEGIREHMKLCQVECERPLYKEGMAVVIRRQPLWVKFRFWNEISEEVIYILETIPGGRVCSLHEDILVQEDEIHGKRVDQYHEDKLFF